jgi:hypothetical protein
MNREVGGFGHDPKTEPVEAHIEKKKPYCFEDQTVAAAEQIISSKGQRSFVTAKILVGTINIEAIAQEKDGETPGISKIPATSAKLGVRDFASPPR